MPTNHPHEPEVFSAANRDSGVPTEPRSGLPDRLTPLIERAQNAFRRDLPELLKLRGPACQWVAYHGDQRIALGRSKTELYQECLRRGLTRGTFVVRSIEPEVPREVDNLPDV